MTDVLDVQPATPAWLEPAALAGCLLLWAAFVVEGFAKVAEVLA